jgi:hypothetical protein
MFVTRSLPTYADMLDKSIIMSVRYPPTPMLRKFPSRYEALPEWGAFSRRRKPRVIGLHTLDL